jgi:hypothetical protein
MVEVVNQPETPVWHPAGEGEIDARPSSDSAGRIRLSRKFYIFGFLVDTGVAAR